MTKREKIFNKYGGKCAYCGCELVKGWCIDHLEPVLRITERQEGYYAFRDSGVKLENKDFKLFTERDFNDKVIWVERGGLKTVGYRFPENNKEENLMPSCASCNMYKSTLPLESFRREISLLVPRLNKSFTQYKISKRFGLIQEIEKPIIFYFETFK